MRVLRNKVRRRRVGDADAAQKNHFLDLPEPVRRSLGAPPTDFLRYFASRWPKVRTRALDRADRAALPARLWRRPAALRPRGDVPTGLSCRLVYTTHAWGVLDMTNVQKTEHPPHASSTR